MAKSSVRERVIAMIRDYETNGCVDTDRPDYRNALHAVACRVSLVQLKDLSNANADQLTQMLKAWVNDPKKFPADWTNNDYKYYRPPNWPLPVWQHTGSAQNAHTKRVARKKRNIIEAGNRLSTK